MPPAEKRLRGTNEAVSTTTEIGSDCVHSVLPVPRTWRYAVYVPFATIIPFSARPSQTQLSFSEANGSKSPRYTSRESAPYISSIPSPGAVTEKLKRHIPNVPGLYGLKRFFPAEKEINSKSASCKLTSSSTCVFPNTYTFVTAVFLPNFFYFDYVFPFGNLQYPFAAAYAVLFKVRV
mgnify:CR=1 FL=1